MPEAYGLQEVRLVQQRFYTSAADATSMDSDVVPAGKIWTVIALGYYPSVNETRTVMVTKVTSTGRVCIIMNPVSVSLQPMLFGLDQGMQVQLFPGENLRMRRDVATAGSTMSFTMQYIESDVPLYDYIEPLQAARIRRATVNEAVRGGQVNLAGRVMRAFADRGGRAPSKGERKSA